jgi:hypothetical protein
MIASDRQNKTARSNLVQLFDQSAALGSEVLFVWIEPFRVVMQNPMFTTTGPIDDGRYYVCIDDKGDPRRL